MAGYSVAELLDHNLKFDFIGAPKFAGRFAVPFGLSTTSDLPLRSFRRRNRVPTTDSLIIGFGRSPTSHANALTPPTVWGTPDDSAVYPTVDSRRTCLPELLQRISLTYGREERNQIDVESDRFGPKSTSQNRPQPKVNCSNTHQSHPNGQDGQSQVVNRRCRSDQPCNSSPVIVPVPVPYVSVSIPSRCSMDTNKFGNG